MSIPPRYEKQSPDIPCLITLLAHYDLRYVLTGSVAASLYGAEVIPGDLDITPALDHANLTQLVALLRAIDAMPAEPHGHWETTPDGEQTWVLDDSAPSQDKPVPTWHPDPTHLASLDHLFVSRYGNFDVVPELAGSYAWLMERAIPMQAYGATIWVAHVDDLLASLTVPRRQEDVARVHYLRTVQRQAGKAHTTET